MCCLQGQRYFSLSLSFCIYDSPHAPHLSLNWSMRGKQSTTAPLPHPNNSPSRISSQAEHSFFGPSIEVCWVNWWRHKLQLPYHSQEHILVHFLSFRQPLSHFLSVCWASICLPCSLVPSSVAGLCLGHSVAKCFAQYQAWCRHPSTCADLKVCE